MPEIRAWRLRVWATRMVSSLVMRRLDTELDAELKSHLQMLVEENIRKGMPPEQARLAARRTFGGVDQTKETYREQLGFPLLDTAAQDIRYGLHQLRKSPGFAATAIVTLALGIGANTAVFSLIYGLMLSRLPVPHPEQLVRYRLAPLPTNPSYSAFSSLELSDLGILNGPMGESIRRRQSACSDIFSWKTVGAFNYQEGGESQFISGALVSGSAFGVLGVKPAVGRLLDESDDRPGGANGSWQADISYAFWQREFHGDRTAIGRTLTIDHVPVMIAGVLPRIFEGVIIGASPDIILPLEIDAVFAAVRGRPSIRENKFTLQVAVIGRLKPGVSIGQARANADAIQEGMFDDAMPPAVRYNPFATTQRLDVTSASTGWSFYRTAYDLAD
jgi:hypothetical protein